jgi:L-ascorbate metabolism protein UlaG (beta-lactamase superfamily)
MGFSTRDKTFIGAGLVIVIVVVVMQFSDNLMPSPGSPPDDDGDTAEGVKLTLLTNAGVMIEANGTRIYIDPIDLPSEYGDSPADAILITHDHGDHYQQSIISMLQKEGTVNVFPKIMEDEIERHDGTGVVPGDEVTVGSITVTAFYMYTYSPTGVDPATHPAERNYTSYIVDIDGFTIFHAGDSKNIPEYEELTGTIDVALLPLGPGCQTMAGSEVVDAIRVIEPGHFVPIHFRGSDNDQFVRRYRTMIESRTECEICNLDYYTSHTFETS